MTGDPQLDTFVETAGESSVELGLIMLIGAVFLFVLGVGVGRILFGEGRKE